MVGSWVIRVGLTRKKLSRVMGQSIFASSQKNQVQVRSGQKILTRFAMSMSNPLSCEGGPLARPNYSLV